MKLKKIISLLLATILCVSLSACSGVNNKLDVENAIVETPVHIYDDALENQAKAMQNTYIMECSVDKIDDMYFEDGNSRIYLDSEVLATLNNGDNVAVICRITEVIDETDSMDNITYWIVFGEAQLYDGEVQKVEPREHEIFTGLLKGKNDSYEGAWNIQVGDSNYLKLIYFAEGTDLSSFNESYNSGEKITFSVDISNRLTNIPDEFRNAKIIDE